MRNSSSFHLVRYFVHMVLFFAVFTVNIVVHAQVPRPTRVLDKKELDQIDSDLRKHCENHFPAISQRTSKTSCYLGLALHKEKKLAAALTECTKLTSAHSGPEQACRIGVLIAEDVANKQDNFTPRLKLCQNHYPVRIEADTYLQESCLIGVYLAHEFKGTPTKKPKLALCEQISKDGAFIGPCGAGLSLASEPGLPSLNTTSDLNRVCNQYFDQAAFHQGYRACLNARALLLEWDGKPSSIARQCRKLSSSKHGDAEAAACVIGGNLLRHVRLAPMHDNPRFKNCGQNKVRWSERDYMVCLTAASLLDLGSTKEARGTCGDVFGGRRSSYRNECLRAVDTLSTQAVAALPSTSPTPMNKADAKSEDADLWPESPDVPPEEIEADEQPAEETSNQPTTSGGLTEEEMPAILGDQGDRGPVSVESTSETPDSGDKGEAESKE